MSPSIHRSPVLIRPLIYLSLFLLSCSGCAVFVSSPSDASLIARFEISQAKFEELRKMTDVDTKFRVITPKVVIGPGQMVEVKQSSMGILESQGLTETRFRKYLQLFSELGLTEGGIFRNGDSVEFRAHSGALWNISTKGYVYSPLRPEPLLPSLDNLGSRFGPQSYYAYKHLKGNWYLVWGYVGM
jgi:hypothetical protein